MNSPFPHLTLRRTLLAGLAAGGVAAIVTSLVSLTLRSPDPVFINSASVTLAVLIGGALAGLAYQLASQRPAPIRSFLVWIAAVFLIVLVGALLVEAAPGHPLLHVATFCIPLAAIALALLALLTPLLVRPSWPMFWLAPVTAVAALAIGLGLAGRSAGPAHSLAIPQAGSARSGATGSPAAGSLTPKDVTGVAFVVDSNQSKAMYKVREQLSALTLPDDAIGTTSQVGGTILLDGRPSTVSVDVRTFHSDQKARDDHLLRDPGLANFAPAVFTVSKLDLPTSYKPGDTITRKVEGTMKLNNVEKPMTFSVEARLDADKTLFVHGTSDFTWQDFNIAKPVYSGLVRADDTIHTEVLLVAKEGS